MTETQKKIYQIAYEEHDHDGFECQLCGLLVEVGFLPDYEPDQEGGE